MQPRYFIGITLPDSLSEKITLAQHELFSTHKVMEPLTPHITLLHPNILMTLSPLYFLPKVKEIADAELPIAIELSKTAIFDDRVLHIAVKSPGLLALQKKLVGLLPDDIRARYEVGRDYTPHVTLAQAKPLQGLDPLLVEQLQARVDSLLPKTFETANISKFTWIRPRKYKIQHV
jgi:2'-5' RNA ligase